MVADGWVGRIGKMCRERYINRLNPDTRKDKWAPEEVSWVVRGSHFDERIAIEEPF